MTEIYRFLLYDPNYSLIIIYYHAFHPIQVSKQIDRPTVRNYTEKCDLPVNHWITNHQRALSESISNMNSVMF